MGIYLLKVNNKNFRARCVNCSKLTKKRHKSHLTDIATLRNLNVALVSSLLTLKRFHTFSQHFTVEIEECCWLGLPTGINVQTSKTYETSKDRCKSYHISQTDQTTTSKETCIEFKKCSKCLRKKSIFAKTFWANIYNIYWDFCSVRITSLYMGKNCNDSYFHVRCSGLYLINIFMKSRKAERCTDIVLKLTFYCLSVTVEDLNL